MSQAGMFSGGGPTPPGTAIQTITGDTGGPVGPTAGNINLLTADTTIQFVGNPGTSTITQDFGLSNLILGSDATGITVGLQNVGLGLTALDNITAGSSNIGIGAGALFNNTTGSNNIAVGSSALLSNTTSNQNVAIGTSALQNSDAFGNIAIGHQTLFSNTTGINNVAISPLALTANVSGNDNVAIGLGTLLNNVSGISNIGIGSGVLVVSTNNENIGIGQGSLSALATGFNNIAIGINAGNAYTTNESNNITIGLVGVVGESNVTRIANIYGDTVGATNAPVFIDNTGKLGTMGGGTGDVLTLTGNDAIAVNPDGAGNIDVITANSTVRFLNTPAASNNLQLDFGLNNLVLGSSLPALAGGNFNVGLGNSNFNSLTSGVSNVAVGYNALLLVTTGDTNVAVGQQALRAVTSGDANTAVGLSAGTAITTGSLNVLIGANSGNAYTTSESSNIILNHTGIITENNTLRIGASTGAGSQQLNRAFICGIDGVNVGSVAQVVTMASDQLGTATITAGAGITVTPGANTITISSTGADLLAYTNVNASPYVVAANDEYLGVDVSVAPITLQFPNAPSTGRVFIVKDFGGFAATNNITLTSVGGAIGFDGSLSYVMNTNYQSVQLLFDGTNYQLF